ncbi:MAG: ABC transporter permease [SAR202 cluster bacterium]|jgi:peptide/nickel transport system permease protein|nr:ABC transporter permease [Dehalococcoidia bacterium]MQG12917.1 ABC transporter permease [SAR202 cluster bacterium]|tara:strand:+ start:2210 stop:3130 length:921 start_codon:yes stop_codon:yes gene_type:complete
MQRFLMRRFLMIIVTLIAVSMIIFIMARVTGDPRVLLLDENASQEQWERMGEELGLDKPYYHQYGLFMKDVLRGNFGESIKLQEPVMTAIAGRIWPTVQLGGGAFLLALVVGIPLGVLSAVMRGTAVDQLGRVIAMVGQAAPSFWLGIMFMFFFAVKLGWVPPSGREGWNSIILPMVTLAWGGFLAGSLRLMRSAMLDVMDSEYIKLAKAKGVSTRSLIWKHAFRNALIPPLTLAGVSMPAILTGSITTELVFAWPGMGQLAIQALYTSDYPLLQGLTIVFTLGYVGVALAVDVLYAYIDPRIRFA